MTGDDRFQRRTELGHLLLPAGSHSPSGVMQGKWDPASLDMHHDHQQSVKEKLQHRTKRSQHLRDNEKHPIPRARL
jgi:hypothetical protein